MKHHGREAEPHPRQAHHLGDAGGAEAEHRPRLRAHRRAGEHPRLPQGQGAAAHHRPARRQRRRARARRQRGPRRLLPPGRRGERRRAARPPRGRHHRVAEREGLLGRPAARPSRWTCAPRSSCPTYDDAEDHGRRRSRSPTPTSTSELDNLRSRFGTLVTVDRPAKTGDFAQIDLVATIGDEEVDTANSISYEIGSGELIEGIDEALDTLTAGETTTFEAPLHRRRPRGREGRDHRHASSPSRSASSPRPTTTSRRSRASSTPSASCATTCASRSSEPKTFGQGASARDKLVDELLEQVEIPVPAAARRGRGAPPPRAARTASRTTCTAPRSPSRARRPSARRSCSTRSPRPKNVKVSQDELTQYLIQGAAQYGMEPERVRQGAAARTARCPSMVGEVARNKALAIVLGKVDGRRHQRQGGRPLRVHRSCPTTRKTARTSSKRSSRPPTRPRPKSLPPKSPPPKRPRSAKKKTAREEESSELEITVEGPGVDRDTRPFACRAPHSLADLPRANRPESARRLR